MLRFRRWADPIRNLQNTLLVLVFLSPWAVAQQLANPQLPPSKVTDERILFFQAQLARDPDYYLNYNRLALAYTQKARETGDISYYDLAEKALFKSLQLESQHEEAAAAFAQLGAVEFAEHRFPEALVSSERALKLGDDPAARALAGDAQLEMGNYPEAAAQFATLATTDDSQPHFGSDYLSATRRASLAWIHGDVSQAISLMRQATVLSEKAHLPAENVAWTYFMLGEQMFQSGNIRGAEAEVNASLAAYPSYHRALAAMGQVRTAQLRFDDAADYYRRAIAVIPLPTYASALGDIYYRIGKTAEGERQYALVEYIAQLGALSKQAYNRELALFYADHDRQLPQALALARKELELRHDVYTWDALAWALLKNDQAREARDAMQKALTTGTQDSLLYFHAAAIERKLGSGQQSAQYAQRALAINPEFHVRYADQAREWVAAPAKVARK
jgi:tetratricopeptide (TPR) repeat protein